MAGRRRAVGTAGALRSCGAGAADCVREFRELADDAGACGAPGIGDRGGAGRGTRPADPENADRGRTVGGPRGRGRIAVGGLGHEHAARPEARSPGAAERDPHGYRGAAVRPGGLGADRHRVRNGAGMDRGPLGSCRGPERERGEHDRRYEGAVALVLLVGAGLLIKGFSRLRSMNPGFNSANVMTMYLQLSTTRYREIPKQTQFRRELLTRLNSLPGVQAAMVTDIPLGGNYVGHRFVIDGRPPVAVGGEPLVQTLSVMGDYFHVMQFPLRAGRDFTPFDREEQPLTAIVNEEMVREFFPHENPIGVRICWAGDTGPPQWMTVIGVGGDVKHSELNRPTDPAMYTPFSQSDEAWRRFMTLAIRARDTSPGLVEEVKRQIWSVDSQITVSDVHA